MLGLGFLFQMINRLCLVLLASYNFLMADENFGIVVHGGAGVLSNLSYEQQQKIEQKVSETVLSAYEIIKFIGNPVIALLISVMFSIYSLGISRGKKMKEIMNTFTSAITGITMVLLIISGAGALKQILIDSGVSQYVGNILESSSISPLILGWLIATFIRFCVGSATVAGLTTAGIILPIVELGVVNPELMVLAIGSGSLMLSHVNDS